MRNLEEAVRLWVVTHSKATELRDAEQALPRRRGPLDELNRRRLKSKAGAFVEAYQPAIAAAREAIGGPALLRMEGKAEELTDQVTGSEALDLVQTLKMWLETSDV